MEPVLFFIIALALAQIVGHIYLFIKISKAIHKPLIKNFNDFASWFTDALVLLVLPSIATQINSYVEPSGDLNPGMHILLLPEEMLTRILFYYCLVLIAYFLSKSLWFKWNHPAILFLFETSCLILMIIAMVPFVMLAIKGYILYAVVPFFGIFICTPILINLLLLYRMRQAFDFQNKTNLI
ncbi:MAG: hypothetical protein FGM41_02645 [Bacteroidetes bacterium]|nr:hypothetical protein [Bacteroidota bacterium]